MKMTVFAIVMLFSVSGLASGYLCEGHKLNAKIYNHVTPGLGTATPAALIVSLADAGGTVVVLRGTEITKTPTESTVIYNGTSNGYTTGRFTSVVLSVNKQPRQTVSGLGIHDGLVSVRSDKGIIAERVNCTRYLKNNF